MFIAHLLETSKSAVWASLSVAGSPPTPSYGLCMLWASRPALCAKTVADSMSMPWRLRPGCPRRIRPGRGIAISGAPAEVGQLLRWCGQRRPLDRRCLTWVQVVQVDFDPCQDSRQRQHVHPVRARQELPQHPFDPQQSPPRLLVCVRARTCRPRERSEAGRRRWCGHGATNVAHLEVASDGHGCCTQPHALCPTWTFSTFAGGRSWRSRSARVF